MTTAALLRKDATSSADVKAAPLVTRLGPLGDAAGARRDIVEGLCSADACISPKFLYDSLGSRLFEAITELPEYYLTRTEDALLSRHIGWIAYAAGKVATLIELGAGNCEKAARLFGALRPSQYVAVDISVQSLEPRLLALRRAYPEVQMIGVGADLTAGIHLPEAVASDRRLFLYLGSSIGNFDPVDAYALLCGIRAQCGGGGGLLIGVDLVKSVEVLQAAYDDVLGVTAAFNLNLLNHLNELLGSNFDVRDWKHWAGFNALHSRMEMHLEARRDVQVKWPGGSRHFAAGQRIHTENSYKYRLEAFNDLLAKAGFRRVNAWTDERQWFGLFHASA